METIITDPQADFTQPARPQFLKTLCILTFIGAGLMILLTLMGTKEAFMSPEERALEMNEKLGPLMDRNPEMADSIINSTMESQQFAAVNWGMTLIANVFTLLGAILMWRLKRVGFYIYCAAELIPMIVSLAFLNGAKAMTSSMAMLGSSFGVIMIVLIFLLDLLFIFLYSRNLKHMTK
jgi:hypothetical protein